MNLGELIDTLYDLREQKREKQEEVKVINSKMDSVEQEIINVMELEQIKSAAGIKATATIDVKTFPQVKDKEAFAKWIVSTGRFEFMQASINRAPFNEMLERENAMPDGINSFEKTTFSLRVKK